MGKEPSLPEGSNAVEDDVVALVWGDACESAAGEKNEAKRRITCSGSMMCAGLCQ